VIVQLEAVEEALSQGLSAKASECLARAGGVARESLQGSEAFSASSPAFVSGGKRPL